MDVDAARALYSRLGAVPVINALGHRTLLGGSAPAAEVRAAMDLANRYFVDMDELAATSGRVVAELLGCEAALVTPGCAAALLLATAACVAGDDAEAMGRLPDTTGLPHEVVIQAPQRYKYDRVVRLAGVRLVEAGRASSCRQADLEAALGPATAAVLYPLVEAPERFLPLDEVVAIAHAAGVPVIADAAFQVSPPEHFRRTAASADLVGFGAKYFGAPNSTGLLCGRRQRIEAARAHAFAAFEARGLPGVGRPLKVDRQEVAGVVAALRAWLAEGAQDRRDEAASRRGRRLRSLLDGLPGLTLEPASGDRVTGLRLVPAAATGLDGPRLAAGLRDGDPSIWADHDARAVTLHLHTVHDGDEEVIADRVRTVVEMAL